MTYAEVKKMQDEMMENIKKDTKDYVTRIKESSEKRRIAMEIADEEDYYDMMHNEGIYTR